MKKVFKLNKGTHWDDDEWQLKGNGLMCHYGLSEFFDIPDKAKTIYVTISNKVMPQSYKAILQGGFFNKLELRIPDKSRKMWSISVYYRLVRLLEEEGLKEFYVRLHHECD